MQTKSRTSDRGPLPHGCPGAAKPTAPINPMVLGRLHEAAYRPLVGSLCNGGVPFDVAHDLALDTLLKGAELGDKLDAERSPLPLLFRIANNQRIDKYRKDRRHRSFTPTDAESLAEDHDEPAEQAAREELAELIRSAMAGLPANLRRVLKRYESGESRQANARRLRISLGQLDRRRARAVRALVAACPALLARS